MRKFLFGLVLVLAACRSLPREVVDANVLNNEATTTMISLWENEIVSRVNSGDSVDLGPIETAWNMAFNDAIEARTSIQQYLESSAGDIDVALGFRTATKILNAIDYNMGIVFFRWTEWLSTEEAADKEEFVRLANEDIARFKELNRKYNEWANQFKVKG